MKRNIITLLLILMGMGFSLDVRSASIGIVSYDSVKYGVTDEEILSSIKLRNPGFAPIEVGSSFTVSKLAFNHEYAVCDPSGLCGPYTKENYLPENTFTIEPLQITDIIYIHLQPNGVTGEDNLIVKYWNKANESDYVEFTLKFMAGISSIEDIKNNSSFASFAYPSITNNEINIKLENDLSNANLEIFDIYGNTIKTVNFAGSNLNVNLENLSQGSYYYNIVSNGLIVSRNNFVIVK